MSLESVELLFVAGPGEGRSLELAQGTHVLGREPGPGGIELGGDPTVSRRHAQIIVAPDGVVFENLSANGSKVNGQLVQGRLRLSGGEELMVGGAHRLAVRLPSSAMHSAAAPAPVEAAPPPEPVEEVPPPVAQPKRARSQARAVPARRSSSRERSPTVQTVSEEEEPTLLQKPWVRALLAIYGGGMLVALALAGGDGAARGPAFPATDWNAVDAEYREVFAEATRLDDEEAQERLLQGYEIYRRMRAHWDRGDVRAYRQSLGKLMAIDGDPRSPIYRYAVRAAGVRPRR